MQSHKNTPTRRTRRVTTNTVGVNVNIYMEAEERRNELLRERIRMARELLNMEKELSQIRSQQ